MSSEKKKPAIYPKPDGPYVVENLESFSSRKGPIESKPTMALCRCGGSENKPFCDGTHKNIGFSSSKLDGRAPDAREDYIIEGVTLHDNRSICAHAGYCTDGLPAVFRSRKEPWIDPSAASPEEIIAVVKKCPSGALSYTAGGVEDRDRKTDPAIFVAPNGPYVVKGGPELLETKRGDGASTEHFTLCRCGGSRNKPFCDGSHWSNEFTDDKN